MSVWYWPHRARFNVAVCRAYDPWAPLRRLRIAIPLDSHSGMMPLNRLYDVIPIHGDLNCQNVTDHPVRGVIYTLRKHPIANLGASDGSVLFAVRSVICKFRFNQAFCCIAGNCILSRTPRCMLNVVSFLVEDKNESIDHKRFAAVVFIDIDIF